MRRGLVHVLAWSLATGAAVTLSWWGVHTVMSGTAYDPPTALPITADSPTSQGARPLSSSTRRPRPPESSPVKSPSATPSAKPGRSRKPSASPSPSHKPSRGADASPSSGGEVKGYTVDGGRVVFDMGTRSAELVSATPSSGWQMQVWKQPTWIRVTFTQGGREISVFCVWHDTAPRVEIDER